MKERRYATEGGVKKTNPRNKQRKLNRCVICGSIYHYVKKCPHLNNSKDVFNSRNPKKVEDSFKTEETIELDEESMVTFALCKIRADQHHGSLVCYEFQVSQ